MSRLKLSSGVTLVELLVVITVIATLAGLVMPAIQNSRAAARRATCQSHLRQWTLAVLNFADDHGGDLPRRGQGVQRTERLDRYEDWFNALPPYVESSPLTLQIQTDKNVRPGGVWMCPELPPADKPNYFAYGMNMWLSTWKAPQPDNLAKVGPLITMVFMADGIGSQCSVLPAAKAYSPDARHGGLVNLAFLDGHVTAIAGDEIGCGVGIVERDDIRWQVPDSVWTGPEDQ
jgi:prepilin-type processing-associated H-X9-DG protein/prepilin-type N-terminal cleavage/methylation domain-containing protein